MNMISIINMANTVNMNPIENKLFVLADISDDPDDIYEVKNIRLLLPSWVHTQDDFDKWHCNVINYTSYHIIGGHNIQPYNQIDNYYGLCNEAFLKILEFLDPVNNGKTVNNFLLVSKQLRTCIFFHCESFYQKHQESIRMKILQFNEKQKIQYSKNLAYNVKTRSQRKKEMRTIRAILTDPENPDHYSGCHHCGKHICGC